MSVGERLPAEDEGAHRSLEESGRAVHLLYDTAYHTIGVSHYITCVREKEGQSILVEQQCGDGPLSYSCVLYSSTLFLCPLPYALLLYLLLVDGNVQLLVDGNLQPDAARATAALKLRGEG